MRRRPERLDRVAQHDDELAAHRELALPARDLRAAGTVHRLAGDARHQTNS